MRGDLTLTDVKLAVSTAISGSGEQDAAVRTLRGLGGETAGDLIASLIE